jgi:chemotaxis response regulator CheB
MIDGSIYSQHPETSLTFKSIGTLRVSPTNNFGSSIFRPCIDDTYSSYSTLPLNSSNCLAFLLTGMGNDGAKGLLCLKKQGHITISQDQNTCLVYGMPKAAKIIGATTHEMSITSIRDNIRFL